MFRQSLWMLTASLLFALVAVSIKYAVDLYSTFEFLFYRSIAGTATCLYLLHKSGGTLKTSHPLRHLIRCAIGTSCLCLSIYILKGLPIATAQALQYTSPLWFCLFLVLAGMAEKENAIGTSCLCLSIYILKGLPIATAQALQYTSPLWFCLFLVLAGMAEKEKVSRSLLVAVLIGFVGIVTILRPDFSGQDAFFAVMGILTGLTGGGADFMIRDLGRHQEPKERIIFYFTLSGTLVGLLATLATTGFHSHTFEGIAALSALMICGTLGQFALTQAWTFGHPILNSIFQFSGIPFAILFGYLCFDEYLDGMTILGILIVMLSGIAASVIRIRSERAVTKGQPVRLQPTDKK